MSYRFSKDARAQPQFTNWLSYQTAKTFLFQLQVDLERQLEIPT